ncbi:hypothetical protein [Ideonella sp. YS5]|uniref:hypothetical protein n=1 Tax=Ideonella sp. YS5 TaxID=3453714 RepID=UPI003EE88DA8
MKHLLLRGGFATLALALSACAADRVAGLRASAARPMPAASATTGAACAFAIRSVDDRREDKSLGKVVRTKVDGEGFATWLGDGLAAIPGHTSGAAPTTLQVEVLKAYIQSIGYLKSANLVVRVTTVDPAGQRQATFRGVNGSTNWNSSEAEIQEAFERALADLQQQVGADLASHCSR